MAVGEFALIEEFFRQEATVSLGVAMGIGDDCALLQVPDGCQLAVSMDTLVGGVHFPKNADPELIAEKALRSNLSDLAAMGAEPLWFTLSLTLPSADRHWIKGFSQGLFHVARDYSISLVGGDTTRGPLAITIQVHGAVAPGKALLRSGACKDDLIFVTGCLGDGAGALAVIKQELEVGKSAFNYFMGRYYRPEPQVEAGELLTDIASSAIDISDGLLADLGHVCQESGVGAQLRLEQLPLSDPLKKLVEKETAFKWALSGGDDYHLCFTVPPHNLARLEALVDQKKIEVHPIGEIVEGSVVECLYNDQAVVLNQGGYEHFSS